MAVRSPPRGYEPRWDLDLERGQVQETLVRRLVSNDPDHLRVEVKGDFRASSSGAHYVEFRCQGRDGKWRDSGIRVTQADYWAVALPDTGVVLMVPTGKVRALAEHHKQAIVSRMEAHRSIVGVLSRLIRACKGDDRPDCPILDELSGERLRRP